MRRHLVVMVRAPRLGAVKRRLAADIGAVAAWRLYRFLLAGVVTALVADRRWTTWLAVTPDGARWRGQPRRAVVVGQGGGDLGARMQRAFARLPPGPVVLVGSDIPGLRPAHVAEAFRRLGAHDAVFGPAEDGGYWLVGFRRRPVLPAPFAGVRWSTPHALADTLARLDQRFSVALVATLRDLDRAADLPAAGLGHFRTSWNSEPS